MSDVKTTPKRQTEITEQVLVKVQQLQEDGGLQLPADYSAPNAIKSAYLVLAEKTDKNNSPVLEVCSKASIANALLTMIVEGLNPIKNQCYFIAYGGKLMYQRGYMGDILLAKRHSAVVNVTAQAIYTDDVFEHEIDAATGLKKILKHEQKLENLDPGKIKGAYCVATLDDGTKVIEIMNILQLRKGWAMRQGKDMIRSHEDFGDEMSKRSVIKRCLKPFINSSSDDELPDVKETKKVQQKTISTSAQTESISFEEAPAAELNEATVIEIKTEEKEPVKQEVNIDEKIAEAKQNQNNNQKEMEGPGF